MEKHHDNPRTTCLQGEPGAGKSKMAIETCINPPVYCMDIDRKMRSAAWAQKHLASGRLHVWELSEPIDASNMQSRLMGLTKELTTKGPTIRPRGFPMWGEQWYRLTDVYREVKFGTVLVDSLTVLNEHMKSMIMYDAGRSKFTFDQWNALKIGWMDSFGVMRDTCIENGWDLIVTVHERIKEEPGDRTTGIKLETNVNIRTGESSIQKIPQGTQEVKVWASIDGAFGDLIGALCDEYYHLYVDNPDKDNPVWRCRVKPDGRRSLRTSFEVRQSVFDPDFRKIWK